MKNSCRPQAVPRSISASEISKNVDFYETWCSFQGCEQTAYSDLPDDYKTEVASVFSLSQRLPSSWIKQPSKAFRKLAPQFVAFIHKTHESAPWMFSDEVAEKNCLDMINELHCVFIAWRQLQYMRNSEEKWSEAEFAAKVYNIFRSPAVRHNSYRTQCSMSLPQPVYEPLTEEAKRILRPKFVVPDAAIFVRAASIRSLSHSKKSPWKLLNRHPNVQNRMAGEANSFRRQTSPRTSSPDCPCFEFISSIWEDKKPNHDLLEQAYRQNRMATSAAARHLHAMHVRAPIFGLIWSNGTVRAHVDWVAQDGKSQIIFSAPYPGQEKTTSESPLFHEWQLEEPCDIVQVYLLIRNLDIWTENGFRERVKEGISDLLFAVTEHDRLFIPWKHRGTYSESSRRREDIENISLSSVVTNPESHKAEKSIDKRGYHRVTYHKT